MFNHALYREEVERTLRKYLEQLRCNKKILLGFVDDALVETVSTPKARATKARVLRKQTQEARALRRQIQEVYKKEVKQVTEAYMGLLCYR